MNLILRAAGQEGNYFNLFRVFGRSECEESVAGKFSKLPFVERDCVLGVSRKSVVMQRHPPQQGRVGFCIDPYPAFYLDRL